MAWVRVEARFPRSRKGRRLARLLGISRRETRGLLVDFWCWAIEEAPSGDLSAMDDDDIADALDWEGGADKLVGALQEAELLDSERRICGWQEYQGGYLRRVEAARNAGLASAAARQGRSEDEPDDSPAEPSNGESQRTLERSLDESQRSLGERSNETQQTLNVRCNESQRSLNETGESLNVLSDDRLDRTLNETDESLNVLSNHSTLLNSPDFPEEEERDVDSEVDVPAESGIDFTIRTWNEAIRSPIPRVRGTTSLRAERRKAIRAALRDPQFREYWPIAVRRIASTPGCRGETDAGFTASFDWALARSRKRKVPNWVEAVEGGGLFSGPSPELGGDATGPDQPTYDRRKVLLAVRSMAESGRRTWQSEAKLVMVNAGVGTLRERLELLAEAEERTRAGTWGELVEEGWA